MNNIDFSHIEYFFAKNDVHTIDFPITKGKNKKALLHFDDEPKDAIAPKETKEAPVSFVPKKKEIPVLPAKPKKQPTAPKIKPPLPKRKEEAMQEDNFKKMWEKKYKELGSENLLAKDQFRRFVLFIIRKNDPKEFAQKIFSAVHSRLMEGAFIISNDPIEQLIKQHNPTHLVTTAETTSLSIPIIEIDNISEMQNSPEKKRALWETLKKHLKE